MGARGACALHTLLFPSCGVILVLFYGYLAAGAVIWAAWLVVCISVAGCTYRFLSVD